MSFDEWLEEHKDEIEELLKNDPVEALSKVWYAGYKEGGSWVADLIGKVYHK